MAMVRITEERGPEIGPAPADSGRYSGTDGLRRATARGSVVYGIFTVCIAALGLAKGFLVAAFLTPADYGIWGLLAVSLGTLLWLGQLGFDDKYIQQDEADQELAFQFAFTLNCLLAAVFVAIMLAALPLFALAYDRWDIIAPGVVLTLAVPLTGLQMPQWFYYRKMDFVKQRTLQAFDPVVSIVVTLSLAIAGLGYWALVIGTISGALAGAAAAIAARPYPLSFRWQPGAARSYVSFSWPLLVQTSSGAGVAQISVLMAQSFLGIAAVGAMSLAATISQYTNRVDEIVSTALYSAVCAAKDRTEVMQEAFSKSNRLGLLWGVPCGVGIALFAPDLVRYWLGERWEFAVFLIQAFGLAAAVNQICFNWSVFFRARGETRPMAVAGVTMFLAVIAIAMPLLVWRGIDGYAVGMLVATTILVAVRIIYLKRIFPTLDIWAHTWRAVAPTIPAGATVLALRDVAGVMDSSLVGGLAYLLLYGVLVAVATFFSERALLRELLSYLRRRSPSLLRVSSPSA